MPEYRQGDIFESGADALVNPVNCVGTPGAGLAKQFARRFPTATVEYIRRCKARRVEPGRVFIVSTIDMSGVRFVVFFPILPNELFSNEEMDQQLGLIELGLQSMIEALDGDWKPKVIAIPALGCGLGGLDYEAVKPVIAMCAESMESRGVRVLLFEPKEET